MFEQITAGWNIGIFGYRFVFRNTKLLILPLLSAGSIFVAAWLLYSCFKHLSWHGDISAPFLFLLALIFYFIAVFISIFFNVATIIIVNNYLTYNDASIIDGIKSSFSKLASIFTWTLISGTVGVLLSILDTIEERTHIPLVSYFLNATWAITTFFVVPIICFKPSTNPFELIKESISAIKNTWYKKGQMTKIIISNTVTTAIFIACVLLFQGFYWIFTKYNIHIDFTSMPGLIGISILGLLIILSIIVRAVLKTIFYRYIEEDFVPVGLDRILLESSLKKANNPVER